MIEYLIYFLAGIGAYTVIREFWFRRIWRWLVKEMKLFNKITDTKGIDK